MSARSARSVRFVANPNKITVLSAKFLLHDGVGMSLYAKRLERGRFVWPSAAADVVSIAPSQLAYMLDGIDWRNPQHTWRPTAAG